MTLEPRWMYIEGVNRGDMLRMPFTIQNRRDVFKLECS